jgi:ubiquinone/menaquinone biosynthesis C-methylase UbiE
LGDFFRKKTHEDLVMEPSESEKLPFAPPTPTAKLVRGRRQIDGVPYVLPKDDIESNRLDFQHNLLRSVLEGNYVAPIKQTISSILDVGVGSGRWAYEMALAFPHAQVIGFDLERPAIHEQLEALPNYQFVQGNIFAGLPFDDDSIDFIHQRFMSLAIPIKQWPFVINELLRVAQPGGYIELVEGGYAFERMGPTLQQLIYWWEVASKKVGIDITIASQIYTLLEKAGLHNVIHESFRVPVGSWGGKSGASLQTNILSGLPGIKNFLCDNAPVSPEAFDQALLALPQEFEQYQTTYEYYFAYGCK